MQVFPTKRSLTSWKYLVISRSYKIPKTPKSFDERKRFHKLFDAGKRNVMYFQSCEHLINRYTINNAINYKYLCIIYCRWFRLIQKISDYIHAQMWVIFEFFWSSFFTKKVSCVWHVFSSIPLLTRELSRGYEI